jgi:hypothetical protein
VSSDFAFPPLLVEPEVSTTETPRVSSGISLYLPVKMSFKRFFQCRTYLGLQPQAKKMKRPDPAVSPVWKYNFAIENPCLVKRDVPQ